MADETFVGKGFAKVFVKGNMDHVEEYQTNGADLKPGHVVTEQGETANTRDVDLASASQFPTGVVMKGTNGYVPSTGIDRNLDTALEDNEAVDVAPRGSGMTVYVHYQTSGATIKKGYPLIVGSEAGKVAPLGAYGNGTEAVDYPVYIVGKAAQDITQDLSNDQIVKMILNVD